ncbi:hypothetical protein GCM10009411_36640 [Shewanella litoralis]|uniref:Uncharacterized protein n=1 Tax=Shewanella litoralis TaxID=2282700 RepID=A0ABQ2RN24_9GAMM|nr:hypothetical protein GCM10009411_36640 [Shewanella litoralis]
MKFNTTFTTSATTEAIIENEVRLDIPIPTCVTSDNIYINGTPTAATNKKFKSV